MNVVPIERDEAPRWTGLLPAAVQLAHQVKDTSFVPSAMKGDEAAIVAAIMYGDEVGLAPMTALATIAIINGRPTVAAEAQRALIQAAGHAIWPGDDNTITKFTWFGQRDGHTSRFQWTIDDAKRAGLAGKQNWRLYPRQMLSARASAELARAVFSDIIHGLAASEEAEDVVEAGEAPPPTEPSPATATRRRRTRQTAPPVIAPTTPAEDKEPPAPPLPGEGPEGEPPPAMTDAQRKQLFALFRDAGMEDRDQRLGWINFHLERTIDSANQLTDAEASILIDELQQLKDSEASSSSETAGPAATDQAGPANQLDLEAGTRLSDQMVETLWWLKNEALVADGWVADRLRDLGVADPPERTTRATLRALNPVQAGHLRDALTNIIDQRDEKES